MNFKSTKGDRVGGRWAREHQRVRRAKARCGAGGKGVLALKLRWRMNTTNKTQKPRQLDEHNLDVAVRADDMIPQPGAQRKVVFESGCWKTMLPTAALRCIFTSAEQTATAVARQFLGTSSGHVEDIKYMGSQLLWECARQSMAEQIVSGPRWYSSSKT